MICLWKIFLCWFLWTKACLKWWSHDGEIWISFFVYQWSFARFTMLGLISWNLMLCSCCLMFNDDIRMFDFKFWACWNFQCMMMMNIWLLLKPYYVSRNPSCMCVLCCLFLIAWCHHVHCHTVWRILLEIVWWWMNMMMSMPCCLETLWTCPEFAWARVSFVCVLMLHNVFQYHVVVMAWSKFVLLMWLHECPVSKTLILHIKPRNINNHWLLLCVLLFHWDWTNGNISFPLLKLHRFN